MKTLKINTNQEVESVFNNYPKVIYKKMANLRRLVIEAAEEIEDLTNLEETLKWGEPSYLTKKGSTLRMDWKQKTPNQYQLYFKCTSKLVETFKMVYGNTFNYEKNRAIVFQLDDKIPETELKKCITAALRYHSVKQLPQLDL